MFFPSLIWLGNLSTWLCFVKVQSVYSFIVSLLGLKPKEISIDEEPVKIEDKAGYLSWVPGNVTFDAGNTVGTAISDKLVGSLDLKPDNTKKKKVTIPGGTILQCRTAPIKIIIRGQKFNVNALVGAVAPPTDLLIGMDVMQKLGDKGYSLKLI